MFPLLSAIALSGLLALATAHPGSDLTKAQWEAPGQPWLGVWQADRAENWPAFVEEALGLALNNETAAPINVKLSFWKDGDHFHRELDIPTFAIISTREFRLGESEITAGGATIKVKYADAGEKLVVTTDSTATNEKIQETYEVTEGELVWTYKKGEVLAKRWFFKQRSPIPATELSSSR